MAVRKRIVSFHSLFPTKVDKDLEHCIEMTTEKKRRHFWMKKGVKFNVHWEGQNALNIWHKARPKYKNISMDVKAKWQLKIFAL